MNNKSKYNPNIHHRRSIRLKGYDYSQAGLYFITICCQDRICRFGDIVNGEMVLNEWGQIAFDEWMKTIEIRSNVALGECIIMPNHIHGIIQLFGRGESHSPSNPNELHSPSNPNESHSPNNPNELHSPSNPNESHSPNNPNELHSPSNPNESYSNNIQQQGVCDTNIQQQGVCDTNIQQQGVCDTPLRSPSQTIGAIVRGYKSSVTKQLGLLGLTDKLWQRNYYEHIIRNEQSHQRISDYIRCNPEKWEDDVFFKS